MTDRLKSCPFCDGEFRINYRGAYEHDSKGCILNGLEIKNHKEMEQWNTRKPMDRIVEKLEELPDVNSDYWNTTYLIDREDVIEIVKGEV